MSFVDGVNSWFSAASYWDGLGPTNVVQPEDDLAFVSQFEEVESAYDNLVKNGMIAPRRKNSFASAVNNPFSTSALSEALNGSVSMSHVPSSGLLKSTLSSTPTAGSNLLGTSPAEPASGLVGSSGFGSSMLGSSLPGNATSNFGSQASTSLLHPRRSTTSLLSSSAHHSRSSYYDLATPTRSSFSYNTVGAASLPSGGLSNLSSSLRSSSKSAGFSLFESASNSFTPSSFMESANMESLSIPSRRRPSSIAPIGTRPSRKEIAFSNSSTPTDQTLRPPNPPAANGNATPVTAVNNVSAVADSPQSTGSSVSSSLPTLSLDFKQEYSGNNHDMSGLSSSLSKSHNSTSALSSQIWSSPCASTLGGVNVW